MDALEKQKKFVETFRRVKSLEKKQKGEIYVWKIEMTIREEALNEKLLKDMMQKSDDFKLERQEED